MSRRLLTVFLLATLAASVLPAWAAEEIRARADKVSGQVKGKGRDVVVLEGNVVVTHGETVIHADKATYDKDAGTIDFSGGVHLVHEGITVDAAELSYLRRTKEGTFRGGVRLARAEERDEAGKTTKDAFSLTADELTFVSERNSFTARGNVSLAHKEFSATAGEMSYDDEHQELTLRKQPILKHDDEEIKAEEIVIAVEQDSFRLIKAEITFTVEEEEEVGETGEAAGPADGSTPPVP